MEIDKHDTRVEKDIRNRVDMIFENYTLEEILEMNDLTEQDVVYLLFMDGQINEPESYLP
jgi:hypothetical protein